MKNSYFLHEKWSLIYKIMKREYRYTSLCECTVEVPFIIWLMRCHFFIEWIFCNLLKFISSYSIALLMTLFYQIYEIVLYFFNRIFFILSLLYFLQFWSQTYFCPKDSYFWLKKNMKFSHKRYISLRYMIEAIKLQLYGQKSPFPRLKIWVDNKIATNIIV